MAFNDVENQAVTETGLINSSKGQDTNEAFGKLFSGIGQTMERGLQSYDTQVRTQLSIDAYNAVDEEANASMPPALAEAQKDISLLTSAKRQGKLSEAEFQQKISARAKNLRAKLPAGYAPMVDQMLSSSLGSSTANDLRKARINELNAAEDAVDASAKERRSYLKDNEGYLRDTDVATEYKSRTGRDLEQDVLAGDYNYPALQYAISGKKTVEQRMDALNKKAAFDANQAAPAAREIMSQAMKTVFNREAGKPFGDFIQKMSQASGEKGPGGTTWTPEEKAAVTGVWNNIRLSAQQELLNLLANPAFKSLKNEDRASLQKQVTDQIAMYDDFLTNEKWGMLSAAQREAAYVSDQDKSNMMKISPIARQFALARELNLPDQVMNSVFMQGSTGAQQLKDDLAKITTGEALVGERGVMDLIENEVSKDTSNLQPVVKGVIDNLKVQLNNPNLTEKELPALAVRIFRDQNNDLLRKLSQKDRIGTFRGLVTPRVIEALKKDPAAFANLERWATVQFDAISKTARDTMFSAQKHSSAVDITFDGTHFIARNLPAQPGVQIPGQKAATDAFNYVQQNQTATAIGEINQYIDVMKPIWEERGLTVDQATSMIFQQKIDDVTKEGTLLQWMGTKVQEFFQSQEEGAGEKKPATKPQSKLEMDDGRRNLLAFVSAAEGADYQTMYGGSKAELEGMTVSEVLAFNKGHGKKTGSSATGAYQIMHDTLRDLVAAGVVDEDEMFTPEVQDRAALALLNRRGYAKFKAGKISAEKFADNIAWEWASLPNAEGRSQYEGDKMGNKSTRRRKELMSAIQSL